MSSNKSLYRRHRTPSNPRMLPNPQGQSTTLYRRDSRLVVGWWWVVEKIVLLKGIGSKSAWISREEAKPYTDGIRVGSICGKKRKITELRNRKPYARGVSLHLYPHNKILQFLQFSVATCCYITLCDNTR